MVPAARIVAMVCGAAGVGKSRVAIPLAAPRRSVPGWPRAHDVGVPVVRAWPWLDGVERRSFAVGVGFDRPAGQFASRCGNLGGRHAWQA